MVHPDRALVWLHGEIRTPPFSAVGRIEAGQLLRALQRGIRLHFPHVRAMPTIGARCLELRIPDEHVSWRVVVRVDHDAVVIAGIFAKKSTRTPDEVIRSCRRRLAEYDRLTGGE